jgi:twitching motility protein PilT
MEISIDDLLRRAVDHGASDIHLKVGSPPILRVEGELRQMGEVDSLTPGDTEGFAASLFTDRASANFAEKGVADFAYGRQDIGRFRVTTFRQRGSVSLVLRRVGAGSKTFAELGLPRIIEKVASATSGLVVVTGASASGKTTTISSIVDWINSNRSVAILTVEDPIEVLHPDKRSVVVQREVGVDTPDMASAIRSSMRHDADVILISELAVSWNVDAAEAAARVDQALGLLPNT